MVWKLRYLKGGPVPSSITLNQVPSWFCNKLGRLGSLDFELGTGELVERKGKYRIVDNVSWPFGLARISNFRLSHKRAQRIFSHKKAHKAQKIELKPFSLLCFCAFLSLKMDNAALEGAGGGLSAVGHAEFAEDVVDVALHGRFTDVQRARDLFVRLTFHDLLKDLELSIREL